MDKALLRYLRCPLCKNKLRPQSFPSIKSTNQGESAIANEADSQIIETGILICESCRVFYPIECGVPVLLVFRTTFHDSFLKKHNKDILEKVGAFTIPSREPRAGEKLIQDSFTDEWDVVHDNEIDSFGLTQEDLIALNKDVWLSWAFENNIAIKSILNAGVGLGRETIVLSKLFPNSETIGVDLGFALLRSSFVRNSPSNAHFVIASLFDLPFAPDIFDFVYSKGVLHHTHSTQKAFEAISRFVAPRGHIFIWVYEAGDELARDRFGNVSVSRWHLYERILRRFLATCPKFIRDAMIFLLTAHYHRKMKKQAAHSDLWTRVNTEHSIRDWVTPYYAHRHTINEVVEWFECLGFKITAFQSAVAYRKRVNSKMFGIGLTGQKE